MVELVSQATQDAQNAEFSHRVHSQNSAADGLSDVPTVSVPGWLTQVSTVTGDFEIPELPLQTRIFKRMLDIAGASLLLVLTLPVLLMSSAAIRLTSPGPVFFFQTRTGINQRRLRPWNPEAMPIADCRRRQKNFGRPFTIYKLRTMHHSDQPQCPAQALPDDVRVTTVGRFLRRFRIDELPQLVNVIKGDMSLVGPRPECVEYMESLSLQIPGYLDRLGLKPGLTGVAQIENGYANDLDSYQRKIAYDLMYLRNCCVINDLKILVRTVKVVLTGFGAI